ncbi:DNA-processing protein DprA [Fructobacillus papyrifericola]|uniref:DNA-protecting protein DprA n=1 Tax=Fructobacillus papyrifericola TaxID=2713172 RepID=A0ABS5QRW3_9LACO|nr:DNA-processing protein DprA [Fructobacillus papyrifericola]MBS9335950.1 DNA-protecting protein DprA [Fructobacillus papyrifericola]
MLQGEFLLALHLTKGLGIARKTRVIEAIKEDLAPVNYPWSLLELSLVIGFDVNDARFPALASDYQKALAVARNYPESYLTYFDADYPKQLREIYQPPLVLFYRGDLRALKLPSLAVVGTRTATPYGQEVLRALLPELLAQGIAIVSGLAKGIDVMAHQVTFSNGGVPIAVIGSGLGRAYPRQNRGIQEAVAEQGLLLSEYPLETAPHRGHFPERNRIIAGLASATLVVEAKQRSGSLITANSALQNNREVLAVPGSIFSAESAGCHELIAAGARPVTTAKEILVNGAFYKD